MVSSRGLGDVYKRQRLSKAGAFIGGLLQIHPIVYFTSDSKVDIFEKQRTLKRVYQRYLQIVDDAVEKYESGIEVGLAHGDNLADTEWLSQQIKQKYPHISIRTGYLSPVIGTHGLSLIHISEPTRRHHVSRMPSSA